MLHINDLSYSFNGTKKVLNNIHTVLEPGKIYGLLGPNGVGKSTLIKCIAGQYWPAKGQIILHDRVIKDRTKGFLEEIFYMPEDGQWSDAKPIEYEALYSPLYPRFDSRLYEKLCNDFGIPLNNSMDKMSYGQKKKVWLAFGLACNTSLCLLDEPSNGLDIESKSQFRKALASSMSSDKSILISTHQVTDIDHLIDHVLIMNEGNLVLDASLSELTKQFYFGVQSNRISAEDQIYTEVSLAGRSGVYYNTNQIESNVDLELLFKATMRSPHLFAQLLN